jgi:hypothetical protein
MVADLSVNKEIAALQQRVAELDRERASVLKLSALEQLEQRRSAEGAAHAIVSRCRQCREGDVAFQC